MGLGKIGDDRPRFRCYRYERFVASAPTVIRIDNEALIGRPAADGAKSKLIPAQHSDMSSNSTSVYLDTVALDARDIAEADDCVAIWQHQVGIG